MRKMTAKDHSNERLLELYIAARALAALHRKKGGLKLHLSHSEKKAEEYRAEILRRMGHSKRLSEMFEKFTKGDLFSYQGSYEDFPEWTERYFAQLAVNHYGFAVRDNSIQDLIIIGRNLEKKSNG